MRIYIQWHTCTKNTLNRNQTANITNVRQMHLYIQWHICTENTLNDVLISRPLGANIVAIQSTRTKVQK